MRRASSFSQSKVLGNPMFSQLSQAAAASQDGKKTVMYFVIPPGETKQGLKNKSLGEMYKAAEAHFLSVQWIEDKDCKDVELEGDGNIFVFDPFGSDGFKFWERKIQTKNVPFRVEIFGPHVLRYVFNAPDILSFQTKSIPTYTLTMRNMIISLSGFKDTELKEELETLIRFMNGTVSSSLTRAVTHVVTTCSITKKCIEAQKEQIPVMTADWVRNLWKDNQISIVEPSDTRYVQHVCPIFYNVNICMSGISSGLKATLKAGIERHGGIVSGEMVKGTTDVLVLVKAEGQKYKYAQKWKVFCVTPEWVNASVEKGHLVPPDDYIVSPSNIPFSSTPAHSHIFLDFNATRCSAIMPSSESDNSRLVINESNNTSQIQNPTPLEIHDNAMIHLKAAKTNVGSYLDGCRIYVVDYEKSDELKRVLNTSGAIRMNQLVAGVTHVIVPGTRLPKQVQDKINELDRPPYLVTIEWLVQSAKDGSPADEELYKFEDGVNQPPLLAEDSFMPPPPVPPVRPYAANTNVTALSVQRVSSTTVETEASYKAATAANSMNVTESETRDSRPSVTPSSTTHQGDDEDSDETTAGDNEEDDDDDDDDDDDFATEMGYTEGFGEEPDEEPESPGVFSGFSFNVLVNNEEERAFLRSTIRKNGGSLRKMDPTVVILQPICSKKNKDSAEKAHTKFWLLDCIENNTLDLERSFHYFPLPCYKNMGEIFKDVVVAVSQYSASEREYLVEMISAMGGICQDVFRRRDGKNSHRSTHLVCKNSETEKAKAAKLWGVPIVVAEWVVESFVERKRLDEERYDPSVQSNSSDERTVFMPTPQSRRLMQQKKKANLGEEGNSNSNESGTVVYPPSTQKDAPVPRNIFAKKDAVPEPQPIQTGDERPVSPNPPDQAPEFKTPQPGPSKKPSTEREPVANQGDQALGDLETAGGEAAGRLNTSDRPAYENSPSWEEYMKRKAEFKAMFPYTDEEYQELLDGLKAKGINLDEVSPFTSFEDRRLCDPNPDSPLILDLPRHESRALKEQIEIALNRTPNLHYIKMKTPTSTPMSEVARRFYEWEKQFQDDSDASFSGAAESSPGRTSTPKSDGQDLRRRATFNRLSQGNNSLREGEDHHTPPLGIRRLSNKRPSDGSPEDEGEPKRARKSSENNEDERDHNEQRKSASPNENAVPQDAEGQDRGSGSSTGSACRNKRMQALTNLINESQPPPTESLSPSKRKSGDVLQAISLPDEEGHEEIEKPHISLVDGDDEEDDSTNEKKSTVKRGRPRRLIPEPEPEPEDNKGKKRSRSRKTPSEVQPRTTRRTRSQSKTRAEDTAPVGHKPIKVTDSASKKTSTRGRKKGSTNGADLPQELPDAPVFMMSSLTNEDKARIGQMIEDLGGSQSKLTTYDPECVGLITGSLLRSEKILGCIAAGKYLLKTSYIIKSYEAGHYLPVDEEFLWNENNIQQEKEREMAKASWGWMKAILAGKTKGPMDGMRILLLGHSRDKTTAYTRLINAGGGEVVHSMEEATIVIKDEKSAATTTPGIPVKNAMYLNSLILRDPDSKPSP